MKPSVIANPRAKSWISAGEAIITAAVVPLSTTLVGSARVTLDGTGAIVYWFRENGIGDRNLLASRANRSRRPARVAVEFFSGLEHVVNDVTLAVKVFG